MRSENRGIAIAGLALMALGLMASCDDKKTDGSGPAASSSAALAAPSEADVKAGEKLWAEKGCVACHSVGQGDKTGPDLKDVTKRRDRAWLVKWMKDPDGMAKNDPIGKEIFAKYKNVPMPKVDLTDAQIGQLLAYITKESSAPKPAGSAEPVKLSDSDFAKAKQVYFDRCAGCHGTLRAGATGPKITPEQTTKLGTETIKTILHNGTPGGMPAWGKEGVLTKDEIELMAKYVQMPPPDPPLRGLEEIKKSHVVQIAPDKRPTKPLTKRNWENMFGVIIRDKGEVAIIDGDTKELVGKPIKTGFAVHILRSSSSGRYFLAVGRDGRVSMIDLWTEEPTLVAQVQGCSDARSVDGSKAKGWEDKLVVQGCYWPPQYIVYDGATLEPKEVVQVPLEAYDDKEKLKEVRVAAIFATHDKPLWFLNFKESGYVGVVDYSKPKFPITKMIPAERFLHDGGWDNTKDYLLVAANMKNQIAVIDVKKQELVKKFQTGNKPHPGRGSNWKDPEWGWVNGTVHIGEGKFAIYGADPKGKPDNAWKVLKEIKLPAAGGLFNKTHEKSPWVWMDSTLDGGPEGPKQICLYSKKKKDLEKCFKVTESGRAVHFEYNKAGNEVWLSIWDKKGKIIVYDDAAPLEKDGTPKVKKVIEGDWLVTPTGKFNVYNTAHDVY